MLITKKGCLLNIKRTASNRVLNKCSYEVKLVIPTSTVVTMLLPGAMRAFLWLPCLLHVTDAQYGSVYYPTWLTKLSQIPDVDSYPTVTDSLPDIPVEVEIELKNSNRESCEPLQWYNMYSSPKHCFYPTCAHSKPNSLILIWCLISNIKLAL
ncbi:hypothetical protein EB796_001270 [Bugula neritina]|uniref:Uncharacterized protein n=1 Tax=Bugula neritina TaxID=10212 RepID=A0A7J7KQF6_BUGNE|nr:hypothetical protein EB796_001270 [Bugula neritina]